jgi:hypothetical protein
VISKCYIDYALSFRLVRNLSDLLRRILASSRMLSGWGDPTRFACPHSGGFAEENGNDIPFELFIKPVVCETLH